MGVRQGAAVLVSVLCVQGQAEDAHQSALGAHAQGENQDGNEQWRGGSQFQRRFT